MVERIPFWRKVDIYLLLLIAGLLLIGTSYLYSATLETSDSPLEIVKKQGIWIGLGLVSLVSVALISNKTLNLMSYPFYGFALFLLLMVMFVGKETLGAQRWISLGGFTLQPSEIAKFALILGLAKVFSTMEDNPEKTHIYRASGIFGGMALLVIIQPDLGTTLVLSAITLGILLAAGWDLKWLFGIAAVAVILVLGSFYLDIMPSYQQDRLTVFLNPQDDIEGKGYNLYQSQVAIGSGGIWGKGLTKGSQSRLNFLPHNETDFIFSVIGEEGGFRVAMLTLVLFFLLINRAISLSAMASDNYDSILAAGVAAMLTFQVVVNIGMTIGVMPVTGIPLPFLSYGGSSMIATLASMGLLFSVSSRRVNLI